MTFPHSRMPASIEIPIKVLVLVCPRDDQSHFNPGSQTIQPLASGSTPQARVLVVPLDGIFGSAPMGQSFRAWSVGFKSLW